MAAYIRPLGSIFGHFSGTTEDFLAGATIANGDFLQFDGSGNVIPATTGRVIGTAQSDATSTKTVKVLVAPYVKYLVQASAALTSSQVGSYFNLTGGTGAQKLNQASPSTTNGQFLVIAINPAIDPVRTDTTWNVAVIAQYAFDSENT